MSVVNINPLSTCAVRVKLFYNEHYIASATAFFWKHDGRIFMVSNWHVFAGREPRDGQPKNKCGLVPNRLQVEGVENNNPNMPFQLDLPLETDERVLWNQHSVHGQKADVAVLDLNMIPVSRRVPHKRQLRSLPCINDVGQTKDMLTEVGQDVFVLGFPLGIMKTKSFPIWKRASIATEPEFPVDGMACFLIDTATREGMSGAPVIQTGGNYRNTNRSFVMSTGINTKILGIYSGRRIGELGEAQLGVVWKSELIEDIICNPAIGHVELT